MPTYYYVQTSLTGLAILLVVAANLRLKSGRQLSDHLFAAMLLANALLLITELVLNLLNGTSEPLLQSALRADVALFYVLNPLPGLLWLLYVANLTRRQESLLPRFVAFAAVPALLNAVVAVASLIGGFAFVISPEGVYGRGQYFTVMAITCYGYLLAGMLLVLSKKHDIRRREYVALSLFAMLPLIGGALQVGFFGISVVWLSLSISLLMIYIAVQRNEMFTDSLTGLANRRRLDAHIEHLISPQGGRRIGGLMIDVDDFKRINDEFGHVMGDRALEAVGEILRSSFRAQDLVARYGGDEFITIVDADSESDLERLAGRVRENLADLNAKKELPFAVSLSIGWATHEGGARISAEEFLKRIDDRMYAAKADRCAAGRVEQ